ATSACASRTDPLRLSRRPCPRQCECPFRATTERFRKTFSPATSATRPLQSSPGICCAAPLRDPWQESAPRRPSLPSTRWPESESCFCAQRSPEKVAVLAEDHFCGRQVPWLC